MRDICIVVAYYPEKQALRSALNSMVEEAVAANVRLDLFVWDNTPATASSEDKVSRSDFGAIDTTVLSAGENLGFGRAINRVLLKSEHDWAFVLNQDARPFPGAFQKAVVHIDTLTRQVGIIELRQFPFEHPKAYDPVTLDTCWATGAAFFVRVDAFKEVGGFEEKFFMYSEDVDLSLKLRAAGRTIMYLPQCAVEHPCFSDTGEQKPLQALHDRANNLLIRARYGGYTDFLGGVVWYFCELPFRIMRSGNVGFLKTATYVARNFAYFRITGRELRCKVRISFNRWHYGRQRYGASFQMLKCDSFPLVSIIIRTNGRFGFLREAVATVVNQSYPNIQVVVVNDDIDPINEEVAGLDLGGRELLLVDTGGSAGRVAAGNIGLQKSSGSLVGFLDDDDQLYADHVETLVASYLAKGARVVYSLAEEVKTDVADARAAIYTEKDVSLRYGARAFSRVLLWYKNYIPIQSALFERKLFDELGGLDARLDHYEDWSLWVKYSSATEFLNIPKVTSRYRVPASNAERRRRERFFLDVYHRVQDTHDTRTMLVSPADIRLMISEYLKERCVLCITKESIRNIVQAAGNFVRRIIG